MAKRTTSVSVDVDVDAVRLYVVNISTGRTYNGAETKCGAVVELHPSMAADDVARGWLVAEGDDKYVTEEHREAFDAYRERQRLFQEEKSAAATDEERTAVPASVGGETATLVSE